jgi:peptidoglycan/LPS O-acetylase OafA/YrhL
LLDQAIRSLGAAGGAAHKSRQHAVLLLVVIVGAVHIGHVTGAFALGSEYLARFLFVFLLGALGHIYAHRITFRAPAITVAAVSFAAAIAAFEDYRPLGAPGFAYLLLWAVVALPLRWQPSADLSYGMYVYHWPLQLLLVEIGLTTAGLPAFALVSLTVTAAIAYLSWRLVEAPALRQKNAVWIDRLANVLTRSVSLAR